MNTNKQLKYAKDATVKNFTDNEGANFADFQVLTTQQQIDTVNSTANQCRGWYEPVYADEHKYLPVSSQTDATVAVANSMETSMREDWMTLALIALGVFVVYKMTQ